ncbi:hypothetical protein LEP1GSC086_4275 [Leptospira weilii str. LNT 1234]|nr:hypothetical protein LEP1GSC086_4275 [Leptospira weilii str. LNT 1234]QDK22866.1 hypothetical protein FHG67_09200 [Leptospira weilii]QDK27489.1 hypothetical protein FHG68_13030 [Leptospira weilii]
MFLIYKIFLLKGKDDILFESFFLKNSPNRNIFSKINEMKLRFVVFKEKANRIRYLSIMEFPRFCL